MASKRDIEDIVTDAMGNSVTPSRLQQSKKPGFIRRFLGNDTIEGPFTEELQAHEQPHYLFHTTNRVEIPEETAEEGALLSLFGKSAFSPGTLLVTDTRMLLLYRRMGDRVVQEFPYSAIDDVQYQRVPRIERGLQLSIDDDEITFEMWDTENFVEELPDAAAYVSEKSGVTYTESTYNFDDGQFDGAAEALRDQLHQIGITTQDVDTSYVLNRAVTGATYGKDSRTAGIGFVLAGGYAIWCELQSDADEESDHFDPDDIDPEEAAEEMIKWKRFGDSIADRKGGLAGATIGAAITIDQQVGSSSGTRVLEELDLDAVTRELEGGSIEDGGKEITLQALDAYADDLDTLLNDDFFEDLRD